MKQEEVAISLKRASYTWLRGQYTTTLQPKGTGTYIEKQENKPFHSNQVHVEVNSPPQNTQAKPICIQSNPKTRHHSTHIYVYYPCPYTCTEYHQQITHSPDPVNIITALKLTKCCRKSMALTRWRLTLSQNY